MLGLTLFSPTCPISQELGSCYRVLPRALSSLGHFTSVLWIVITFNVRTLIMQARMRAAGLQREIRGFIIRANSIYVMRQIGTGELVSEALGKHESMFRDITAFLSKRIARKKYLDVAVAKASSAAPGGIGWAVLICQSHAETVPGAIAHWITGVASKLPVCLLSYWCRLSASTQAKTRWIWEFVWCGKNNSATPSTHGIYYKRFSDRGLGVA